MSGIGPQISTPELPGGERSARRLRAPVVARHWLGPGHPRPAAARIAGSTPASPFVARALRLAVFLILGLGVAAPAAGQRRVYRPPPDAPLTTEQMEALHRGMLELRQLERTGNRAGAIRRGEQLLRDFPGSRRVEDVLLNLYRVERREADLIELLRVRTKREPADPDATRDLAALLLNRAAVDEAVVVLRRHIADNPKDENRYRLAGGLLASRDQAQLAIVIYREGRDAIGVPSLFAAEVAQMEIERGDFSSAIAEYLLLATDPDRRPRVWREVSSLLQRVDDRTTVLERIEEMRRKYPRTPAIQDIAAMAYLESGRYSEALSAIREADRWASDQGEHLLDFGRVALRGGGPDSLSLDRGRVGVQALDSLTRTHPESGLIPEATRLAAEGLVNLARQLPETSDERKTLLQHAVRIVAANESKLRVPQLANQLRALQGMILLEDLGQPAAALEIFERVAAQQRRLGEPDQLIRVQMALCQAALGQLDVARAALEEIVRSDSATALPNLPGHRRPNRPEHVGWSRARYYLAEFDLIDGKYEEAKKGFAALAEESPEDRLANDCLDLALILNESAGVDPALPRFGSYRRALLLRDRKGMRTELQALVRENPRSTLEPIALYELAGILAEDRDTSGALETYRKLLDEHPEHRLAPRSLEAVGDLQMRALGRPELAVASYEKLLLTYPDDLFLDGVRRKLLAARAAVSGGEHATP